MAKVVELINGNTDAMGNIVDVPEETETIAEPALSERDLRIHELEAERDSYEEWLDKEADKLGWSLVATRAKYGGFTGAKELERLEQERDQEMTGIGAAGILAVLRQRKQQKINQIVDPAARDAAQRDFDIRRAVEEYKKQRPAWNR
ncbi:MAG: hypothetical protein KDA17_03685 [Candidatus Saccharibacteria bacterium]|nr:hypothetical protein [Candidatus Saccharibacteria bacterium]MCA9339986.1 hypothetical protein [Candidatus Saccharibacteria bacterium]